MSSITAIPLSAVTRWLAFGPGPHPDVSTRDPRRAAAASTAAIAQAFQVLRTAPGPA
jgi:hypothetical protein